MIKEKFETEFNELKRKYQDAKGDYNIIKNNIKEINDLIGQLNGRLSNLVLECISLKLYISEVSKVIPVIQGKIDADYDAIKHLKTRIYASLSFINDL